MHTPLRRHEMRVLGVAVILGAAISLVGVSTADAGPSPKVKLKISKHDDGPWVHDLSEEPTPPSLSVGESKNFYLKAKNTTGVTQQFTLHSSFVSDDYVAKWFKTNGNNITTSVTSSSGKQLSLDAGESKKFRLKVKRNAGSANDGCVVTEVELLDVREDFALVGFNVQSACD